MEARQQEGDCRASAHGVIVRCEAPQDRTGECTGAEVRERSFWRLTTREAFKTDLRVASYRYGLRVALVAKRKELKFLWA